MTLSFDEEWMHEAVSNIVKNAFDHTPAGGRIELIGRESAVVSEIIIKDNGAGIHPEDIHSIFKRFYRSRHSKDKQGIGIGLTLSKMIVEQHGGSITAESKPDNGTVFRLVFSKLTNT
jgi:signal transduction histidine kinase